MPLLKYKCNDCGCVFEELTFSSDDDVVCSECKSKNVTRHYQGKCYISPTGGSCSGNCSGCSGCS